MKSNTIFFLVLIFSCSIMSCGDDEQMMTSTSSPTTGTWKAVSMIGDINTSYIINGDTTLSLTTLQGQNLNYSMEMEDDSFSTDGSYNVSFTTMVQGSEVMNIDTYTNVSDGGNYSLSGNDMMLAKQLFEINFNGLPVLLGNGNKTTSYSIINGVMTIVESGQVDQMESNGLESKSEINFISTWQKQ